jgi:dihydroorotate dehydrogenase electron transfer subunit
MKKHRSPPEMIEILEIREETPTVKTFKLDKKIKAKPGQFAMLWIPGNGEKPFSFSKLDDNLEITVKKVGSFTEKLFTLKKGDLLGFRGPYGDGFFKINGRNICIAAGGVGLAPLKPLINEILRERRKLMVIQGAATEKELLWTDKLKTGKNELIQATDDGTCGVEGSVCDILNELVKENRFDQIYTCGPESMMKKIADLALREKIPCQISLERYMKCGIGICGQCCIDPNGLRVCRDGPVFTARELKDAEFGSYMRKASGSKSSL